MEQKDQINYIECPVCGGIGINNYKTCPECFGVGLGYFRDGQFFYFSSILSQAAIALKKIRNKTDLIINAVSFSFGLIGLGFLFFWYFENYIFTSDLGSLIRFFEEKNSYLLIFWLSLFFDMFVIFRMGREAEKNEKIKTSKNYYHEEEKEINIPNNWQELLQYKNKVNVFGFFNKEAEEIIDEAYLLASKFDQEELRPIHLFFVLLRSKIVGSYFMRLDVNVNELAKKVSRQLLRQSAISAATSTRLSVLIKKIFLEAYFEALQNRQKNIEPLNLIKACYKNDKKIEEILYDFEIDEDKLENCQKWFRFTDEIIENYRVFRRAARFKPSSNMNRAYTAIATPILNYFSRDLTLAAKWGRLEICVAREEVIGGIFEKFESGQNGVLLVGEPGVGKNTVVGQIAQLMVKEDVPTFFRDKRLLEIDAARLVSGVNASEAEARLLSALDEAIQSGNIILYIKDMELIVGIQSGGGDSLDLSDVLVGAIENKNIYCLASVDPKSFSRHIENGPLGRVFMKVDVKEPEKNQAIQILESEAIIIESRHKAYFTYGAIEAAVNLSTRYIHEKYLPAKGIEIMDLAIIKAIKGRGKNCLVGKSDIEEAISEVSGVPMSGVKEDEGELLLNLEEKMHERMVGQEEAVDRVAESLRRARAELRDTKRPIASFLFLGPTGVGKTELAKTVAEVYFHNEKAMIRIDMSEYQHEDSIKKMIGDNDSLGYLTEAVRKKPFSLVLLDEFEKAHPEILNLFLQVMDDGRLTDGQGRTIDFTNVILIVTSNAGALFVQEEVKKGTDIKIIRDTLINEHLNKVMRPELINRFDGVIVFKPLTETDLSSIVRLMLEKIRQMLDQKGVELKYDDGGVKVLANIGFDPKFGARPLRRVLQDRIENKIAELILSGDLDRRDMVIIDETGGVRVEKAKEL